MNSFVFVHNGAHPNTFDKIQTFFQSIGIFLYDYRLVLPQKAKFFSVPIVYFLTSPEVREDTQNMDGTKHIYIAYEKDKDTFLHHNPLVYYIQNESEIIPYLLKEFSLTELLPYYECYQKYQAFRFYKSSYSVSEESLEEYIEEILPLVIPNQPCLLYAYAYLEFLRNNLDLATPLFLNAYAQNPQLKMVLFRLFKMYPTHQNKLLLEEKCQDEIYSYPRFYTLASFQENPIEEYQKCIEENTNFYPACFECTFLYDKKGNFLEAKKYYQKVLKILTTSHSISFLPETTYYIANSYYRLYFLYLKEENDVDASKMLQNLKAYISFHDISELSSKPLLPVGTEHPLLSKKRS